MRVRTPASLLWPLDSTVISITVELLGPSARTGITDARCTGCCAQLFRDPLEFPPLPLAYTAHPPTSSSTLSYFRYVDPCVSIMLTFLVIALSGILVDIHTLIGVLVLQTPSLILMLLRTIDAICN